MKIISIIIAAAALSGAAYGQDYQTGQFNRQFHEEMQRQREFMAERQAEAAAAQQREQLEEIQAQQRQIHYELENRQFFQEQQCQPRHFWLTPLELECE
jgi:hypothetical protein